MYPRHTFFKNQVQPFSASFLHQYHPQYHPHITIIIVNNPTLHIPQTVHIVFIFPAQSNTPSMQNKHIFLTNIKYLFTIIITMCMYSPPWPSSQGSILNFLVGGRGGREEGVESGCLYSRPLCLPVSHPIGCPTMDSRHPDANYIPPLFAWAKIQTRLGKETWSIQKKFGTVI